MILGFKQSVQMQFLWLGNAHNQPVGAALAVRNAQGCAIAAGAGGVSCRASAAARLPAGFGERVGMVSDAS
jgi:hypothetical protein